MDVNNCRFCNASLRSGGRIGHSKLIFQQMPLASKDKNIFAKLKGLGLTLSKSRDKSFRSCIKWMVKVFRDAELFQCQVGRQFSAFPNFSRDLFRNVCYADYCKWMKNKLREWRTPI